MRPIRIAFAAVLAAGLATPLLCGAQETKPTKLTADLGYVQTGGNTEVTTLTANDKLEHTSGKWLFTQEAGAVWGETDGVESAGRYGVQLRADLALAAKVSAYALAGWKRNTFSGIARQFDESVGLAWKIIDVKPSMLNLEFGVGLLQRRPTVGPEDNFPTARVGALYTYDISERSQFSAGGAYRISLEDSDQSDGEARFALTAPVGKALALKVGYDMFYLNKPLPGLEKLDTTFSVGIQAIL